jgi:hypothetical protein
MVAADHSVEVLSGQSFPWKWNRAPKLAMQKGDNLNNAVRFIGGNLGIKIVSISGKDIADGNLKVILGLIWMLIASLHLQPSVKAIKGETETATAALLKWCQSASEGHEGVSILDFKRSWKDGRALAAIIHHFRPDVIGEWGEILAMPARDVVVRALDACQQLGFSVYLEPEDLVDVDVPDDCAVITQIAELAAHLIPEGKGAKS